MAVVKSKNTGIIKLNLDRNHQAESTQKCNSIQPWKFRFLTNDDILYTRKEHFSLY